MIGPFAPNQDFLEVSAVFSPAQRTISQLIATLRPIGSRRKWVDHEGVFSFDDCFTGFPPAGGAHKHRVLGFSPEPNKFLLIASNSRSWSSLTYGLTRRMGSRALRLRFCVDNAQYPARDFEFIDKGEQTRCVSILYDDRWHFIERGTPLAGEDTFTYTKRRIVSRLSNQQLIDLAQKFGIPFNRPEKLVAPGVLICQQ